MNRVYPYIVFAFSWWAPVSAVGQETHVIRLEKSCQFQKGRSISHTFDEIGRSSINGNLQTKFDNKSMILRIAESGFRSKNNYDQNTLYFVKLLSLAGKKILSDSIVPNNYHVSENRIEFRTNSVKITLRRNEKDNMFYGILVHSESWPHFDGPRVINIVSLAPMICS